MYELAITFTIKHCEEMIQFIDSQTHHPFMKSYFEEVKKHSMDLGKLTPIIECDKFDRCSRRLQHVLHRIKHDYDYYKEEFIEKIEINMMQKVRNCGKKTLDEFIELRGY